MDIHAFLWLDYRVASLITLYFEFVVPEINIPKIRSFWKLDHLKFVVKKVEKSTCLKFTNGHSDNDYRVATLSKSYLTTTGITMQNLKMYRTNLTCIN